MFLHLTHFLHWMIEWHTWYTHLIYINMLWCIPFPYNNTWFAGLYEIMKRKTYTDMHVELTTHFFLWKNQYQWWFDWRNTERKLKTVRINYYYCSINNWRFHRIHMLVFVIDSLLVKQKKCKLLLIWNSSWCCNHNDSYDHPQGVDFRLFPITPTTCFRILQNHPIYLLPITYCLLSQSTCKLLIINY